MVSKKLVPKEKEYSSLISSIGNLLRDARKKVFYQINQTLVQTYWKIGQRILEFEQRGKTRANYGEKLLEKLSLDLTNQFGKGFSRDNLEKMRKFYLLFPKSETLSRKLSWSHYCLILRLEDKLARNFYLMETEKENWSVRELDRQMNSMLFERLALSKNKQGVLSLAKKGQVISKADDLIKDPYILEFLNLPAYEQYSETDLERELLSNLEQFLLELGKGFMFVARQQRITLEDEHFYIDLVFYNRILRCFVLVELKIGKLAHKDLGQLQMYVNFYNRQIKQLDENPTIGILLCADKKEAVVKFTLPEENKHIFASKYKLFLPNKEELAENVKKILNSPK